MDEFNAWGILKILGGMLASAVLFIGVVYRTWIVPANEREKKQTLQINELQQNMNVVKAKTEKHEEECEQRMKRLYDKLDSMQAEFKDLAIKTGKIETIVTRMEK